MFYKNSALGSFAKFTGKHLCQSLFLIKLEASACNFIKKETLAQVLSCEFCQISKNNFSYRTHPGNCFCFRPISPFHTSLEHQKTLDVWCFQGIYKGNIGLKWVYLFLPSVEAIKVIFEEKSSNSLTKILQGWLVFFNKQQFLKAILFINNARQILLAKN